MVGFSHLSEKFRRPFSHLSEKLGKKKPNRICTMSLFRGRFLGLWKLRSGCWFSLMSNVPHVARVSKEFVLIEKAMYRTLLATCGPAVYRFSYWLMVQTKNDTFFTVPHVAFVRKLRASNVRYIALTNTNQPLRLIDRTYLIKPIYSESTLSSQQP